MYPFLFDIQDIPHISFVVKEQDIQCIRVMFMKKTEFVTLRTTPEIKKMLETLAEEKKWSVSQLSEEIILQWLQEKGYIVEDK